MIRPALIAPIVLLGALLGACGFRSSAAPGDSSGPGQLVDAATVTDAAIASTIDGSVTPDAAPPIANCLPMWMAGTVQLSPPALINLSTNGSERDPWISVDGQRLYFGQKTAGGAHNNIMMATRLAPTSSQFGTAAPVGGVNDPNHDQSRPSLSPDERTILIASNRDGDFGIYSATRAITSAAFSTPSNAHIGNINASGTDVLDPFLTSDGTHLYAAPADTNNHQKIVFGNFVLNTGTSNVADVQGIKDTGGTNASDADPALSKDDLIIVFTSIGRAGSPGGGDLYYATRTDATKGFAAPKLIPVVNSPQNDGDPILSNDGCTLYFSSQRTPPAGTAATAGGDYDLYVSTVIIPAQPGG